MEKEKRSIILPGIFLSAVLVAFDQFTKYLAASRLAGRSGLSVVSGVFELFYLENRGAAFGMLTNRQWFFVVIAAVMSLAAVFVYLRLPADRHYRFLRMICVLVLSGAVGNMLDRLIRRYVIDFLYFSAIDFPVFNVADCYVCIGAGLAVLALFTVYREDDFAFLFPKKRAGGEENGR